METLLTYLFVLIASALAVALAAIFLLLKRETRTRLVSLLVSYACGVLLGATFFGLLPSALRQAEAEPVLAAVLGGLIVFFLVERYLHWHHCHEPECEAHSTMGPLILIGDGIHNFIDGVMIATAFQVSTELGISTALAVLAHEVPQEVGDFGILLSSGYSPSRAFRLNLYSSLSALLGATAALLTPLAALGLIPYVIAVAAASFLYIAVSDLIPDMHRHQRKGAAISQFVLMLAGVASMWLMAVLLKP